MSNTPSVARELAPAGLRSSPEVSDNIFPLEPVRWIYDRFAAERERAPSPQVAAEVLESVGIEPSGG